MSNDIIRKIDSMKDQINTFSREMKTKGKKMKILEINHGNINKEFLWQTHQQTQHNKGKI